MVDRRRVLRVALLGAAGAALPAGLATVAGCGVPSGGRPVVDFPGPSSGPGGLPGGGKPPGPDTAVSAEDLVTKYLLAVAGPLEDEYRAQLQESARAFMTAAARGQWRTPARDITVVRAGKLTHRESNTSTFVDLTLMPVGQLAASGAVLPATSVASPVPCTFEVVTDPDQGSGWRINKIVTASTSLAGAMLLSTDALDDPTLGLFLPQLVYYWSSGGPEGLVPDLRYLPLASGPQAQYTRIVSDMLSDPSSWLAVEPLPTGTALAGRFVQLDRDRLVVNLKVPAPAQGDANRLMVQLRASLWPFYTGPVQLEINSQRQQVDGASNGFRSANLADAPARGNHPADDPPEEYCVANEVARPMRPNAPVPAILDSPLNTKVVSAALSRDLRSVAVVRDTGAGYGLWLGDKDTGPQYRRCVGLPARTTEVSRPAWLPGQPRVLVAVRQRLYAVDAGAGTAVDVTPSGVRRVLGFSVAPDGHRIALIADGLPAIASLSAADQGGVAVGSPLPLFNATTSAPVAIAWSRLERVLIAVRKPGTGANTGYGLTEATIDGAVARDLTDVNLTDPVVYLAAYPPVPSAADGSVRALGQAGLGKRATPFRYLREFSRIGPISLVPSPAPSSSPGRPATAVPTAPFFAD
jgi:Lipoprotein LpqB beta-propeller domain